MSSIYLTSSLSNKLLRQSNKFEMLFQIKTNFNISPSKPTFNIRLVKYGCILSISQNVTEFSLIHVSRDFNFHGNKYLSTTKQNGNTIHVKDFDASMRKTPHCYLGI